MARVGCALASLGLAALAACGQAPTVAPEPPALPRHEIIFSRHSDPARRDYDIWRMCGDGSQLASLVVEPDQQIQLSVAPDGSTFLYASRQEGQRDIWRRAFEGGDPVNLTNHPADDTSPAWSPDGRRIAFASTRDAQRPDLYLMDADGRDVRRLTHNDYYESGLSWSPDGRLIVFTRYFPRPDLGEHAGTGEGVLIDPETGDETRLTELGGYNGDFDFSPDGSRLAFHRVADGRAEIWLVNADSSNPQPVTDTYIDEYTPRWSPDGRWIAFVAGVGNDSLGTFDLWLMRPDGSDRMILNPGANTEGWPEWRPGKHYCR